VFCITPKSSIVTKKEGPGDDGGRCTMPQDHWLPGFNFNVEEWFEGDHYETLAICRSLELARAAIAAANAARARRAAFSHREHLPAKVRTFIDTLAKNFRQTDWGREGEWPGDPIKQAIVANSKQAAS
jgi:hypothetical protein